MTETKPKYANFPERELKVVIGPNINAVTTKALGRLSIGTYEMSFVQQERGLATNEAVRSAISHLARSTGLTLTTESHRDYVGVFIAQNAEVQYKVWITTPFELTQSAHIIWIRYSELTGEKKVGVAFKLSTGYVADDITALLKVALKNAQVLPEGEPYTIKGNPPPRFAKKAAAADAEAPAAATAPAADAPA